MPRNNRHTRNRQKQNADTAVRTRKLPAATASSSSTEPRIRAVKAGDVDTGANPVEAARRQLEGTWDLVSLETYATPGGPGTKAEDASAVLSYDAYGNLRIMGKPGRRALCPRQQSC